MPKTKIMKKSTKKKILIKILFAQVCFMIGDIISFTLVEVKLSSIILNHITITGIYLFGMWHRKI